MGLYSLCLPCVVFFVVAVGLFFFFCFFRCVLMMLQLSSMIENMVPHHED